jgi:hypothetical protein
MLAFGWNTWLAYQIKGLIRKRLMTRAEAMPLGFKREIELAGDDINVTDTIELVGGARVGRLLIGDEMPVRYVPQSRYFQPQELDVAGYWATAEEIGQLNERRRLVVRRTLNLETTE